MADLIDYDSKQAAIISALRHAQQLQQAQTPATQYKQFGGIDHVIAPGPLSGVAAAINRGMGDIQEGQVNRQQSELDANQMREMQDYQRQLAAVPTETRRVLKQTLGGATGTLNQPQLQPGEIPTPQAPAQPEYEDVALTPEEQNAKRSEIAGGMYRLPKAREMAKELWKQTIDFPEKRAEQLSKLAADAENKALALEERARQFDISDETKRSLAEQANALRAQGQALQASIAQMGNSVAQQNADTNRTRLDEQKRAAGVAEGAKADKAQAAKDKLAQDEQRAEDEATRVIGLIDTAIGKRGKDNQLLKGKRDRYGQLLPGEKDEAPAKGFDRYVGNLTGGLQAQYLRGGDAASYKTYDDQLKGTARNEGIKALKGTGSVSNAEGEAAAAAINGANAAGDQASYIHHMRTYRAILEKAANRRARGVRVTPDGREYKLGGPDDPNVSAGGGGIAPTAAPAGAPTAAPTAAPTGSLYEGQPVKRRVTLKNGNTGIELQDGTRIEVPGGGQ